MPAHSPALAHCSTAASILWSVPALHPTSLLPLFPLLSMPLVLLQLTAPAYSCALDPDSPAPAPGCRSSTNGREDSSPPGLVLWFCIFHSSMLEGVVQCSVYRALETEVSVLKVLLESALSTLLDA